MSNSKIFRDKKERIFRRDGYKCKKCGSTAYLTLDHIIPKSAGGNDSDDNLETLCGTCNTNKASIVKLSFSERIRFIWNSSERMRSIAFQNKKEILVNLDSFSTKQSIEDKIKTMTSNATATLQLLTARMDTLTKTVEQALSSKDKKDAIAFVEIQDKVAVLEKALEKEREVYKMMTEFMGIEFVPEKTKKFIADAVLADTMLSKGFSEEDILNLEETKVEPAHFIKVKKDKK